MSVIREKVPTVTSDRYMANDIENAALLVADGTIVMAANISDRVLGKKRDPG